MKKIIAVSGEGQSKAMSALARQIEELYISDIIPATGAEVGDVDVFDYDGLEEAVSDADAYNFILQKPMYMQTAQAVRGLQAKGFKIKVTIATKGATVTITDAQDGYISAEIEVSSDGQVTGKVYGTQDLTLNLLNLFKTMYEGIHSSSRERRRK